MKTQVKRITAVILALCLLSGCLAACGQDDSPAAQNVSTAEMDMIAEAASSLLPSHGSTEGKEETVYVIADAEGAPQRTIVSAWLKNPDEADTITDRSDLSGIENVKGDETYTVDSDGNLIWDAQGSDIYYQGGSDKDLPLTVHVSYKLDGEEISPEELAGASGHLEMTFSYENKTGRQEKIGGKDATIYQPFVVVSCLVLDSAKASAVEVTNGTLINSGEQMIVAGMAMPGLKESLGLDELEDADGETLDAKVPETVTITADVNDFSLLTTVTLVENAMLSDLDLENVDSFDDLKSSVDKLTDASAQLVDGAGSLYDGTKSLSGGTDALTAGAVELDAGARTIATNMGELYNGLLSLQDGAGTLKSGIDTLNEQVQGLPAGAAQLKSGAEALRAALSGQLKPGAQTIASRADDIYIGAVKIKEGADAILKGLSAIDLEAIQKSLGDGKAQINGALDQAAALNGKAKGGADNLVISVADISQELKNAGQNELAGKLQAVSDGLTGISAAINGSSQYIDGAKDGLSQIALPDLSGLADAVKGLEDISSGAAAIAAGAKSGDSGAPGLYEGAAALAAGVDTLISGNDGSNLDALITGLTTLNASSGTLVSGVGELSSGAAKLEKGANTAAVGAKQLSDGANSLAAGAGQLKGGAQSLSDGVVQVMNGASSLLSGMNEFDGDGVKVLSRLFEEDAQGFMDRLRAVQAYGEEYSSFSGLADGMPGTVRFIIRTDSIGE